METGTQRKGRFLRANGTMNEFIIGEGLMCTAEGKLTPPIERRVVVYSGCYMGTV